MVQSNVRACLISNPKSGRGRVDLSEAVTVLESHGWDVAVRQKRHGGDATELAAEAARQGFTVVVDCGGDGTLNEIVEGVAGTTIAVGTIPGGTANMWAHEMGISHRPGVAALQLVGSEQRRVDVGWVAVNGHHKRHFLLCAGLGFDGEVLKHLSKPLKNRIGWLAYAPATIRALRAFRGAPIQARMDEMHWHGKTAQIIIANTRRYGGFTQISPWAYVDDGLLDVCLLTPSNALSAARQMGAMLIRQRPNFISAQLYRASAITIRSPIVLPLEVDGGTIHVGEGDLTDEGVVYTVSLKALAVNVLVPRSYGGGLFQPRRLAEALADIPLQPVTVSAARAGVTSGVGRHEHNGHSGHSSRESHDGHDGHARHDGPKVRNGSTGRNGTSEQNGQNGDKVKTWKARVLNVGADSLTVARVKNGHIVQVAISPDCLLKDASGAEQALWGALAAVTEGDLVHVSGAKDAERGVLKAQRVVLDSRSLHHNRQKQAHLR